MSAASFFIVQFVVTLSLLCLIGWTLGLTAELVAIGPCIIAACWLGIWRGSRA